MDRYTSPVLNDNFKHCVDAWSESLIREEYWCMYDRLAAYEDAEESGLLVRLPCKIGARIYEANALFGKVLQRIASKEDILTKIVPGWGTRYFSSEPEAREALGESL